MQKKSWQNFFCIFECHVDVNDDDDDDEMMMMMNSFCGMVDQREVFSLISSWDHCQRSSPSRISDMP